MTLNKFSKVHIEVFLVAFSLLFLETLYFKTILFLQDYLKALFIVSYALTGLAIGAILAHRYRQLSQNTILTLKIILIFSIFFSVLNFIYFNGFLFLSPVLIVPFAAGNILISYYLKQENAHTIYFIDLFGATLGVISIVFFIPLLREENCFFLIVSILTLSLALNRPPKSKGFIAVLISSAIAFGLLGHNLKYDTVNLVKIARSPSDAPKDKIFSRFEEFNLLYSRGSNVQRIDVLSPSYSGFNDANWPPMVYVAFNGLVNDVVRPQEYNQYAYRYDPRVIFGLIKKPDFLVIGTSAEGVVKTGAAHGGTVTGLEINPQIIDLMQGPLSSYSKNAYSHLKQLYKMDARTYLQQNDTKFDIITLMNSHMGRQSGLIGTPEFLHTHEAISAYMEHLTDQGFMVFEEKYYGDHGRLSSIKIIHTLLNNLQMRGIKKPGAHLFVYHWLLQGLSILGDPEQPVVSHVMIVVKKRPFEPKDRFAINYWANQVNRFYGRGHNIIEIYPVNEVSGHFSNQVHDFIQSYPVTDMSLSQASSPNSNFSIITDDKPFPWSVDPGHRNIKSDMIKIGALSLLLLMAMMTYWQKTENSIFSAKYLFASLYFALIGLGYFVIEIGLMNFYQIFMGSPTYAFVFILGTLLLSSGIGSYFSGRLNISRSWWVFSGIVLFCAYHLYWGRHLLISFGAGPFQNAVIIAASVFPLGFLMGIPFPYGIETIKKNMNPSYAVIFFAVNCLFASFAVIFSFYTSVALGFKITFGIGSILYLLAFLTQCFYSRLK